MNTSLENQRRALLEKMEARRAVYQHMLRGETNNFSFKSHYARPKAHTPSPSERGLQWVRSHPFISTAGLALLFAFLPRAIATSRHRHHSPLTTERSAFSRAMPMLKAAGLLLLKDPTRLRMVGYLTRSMWHWLKHRLSPIRN
jgi:hypothetical protein